MENGETVHITRSPWKLEYDAGNGPPERTFNIMVLSYNTIKELFDFGKDLKSLHQDLVKKQQELDKHLESIREWMDRPHHPGCIEGWKECEKILENQK